jgi:MEDS: MEthanogen/methylotroph, DcmR Sensory domain
MVATIDQHAEWLRDGLGSAADDVRFVDMAELGANPSRIIPAWQRFLDTAGRGQPVRGIGEPIWPGRRPVEIAESQLHEALLNLAVDPETPFWLVCPYDVAELDDSVVQAASRSHPAYLRSDGYHGSASYGGRAYIDSMLAGDLDPLGGSSADIGYHRATVGQLYDFVLTQAASTGLPVGRAADLARACQRLAAGSIHRGATQGRLTVWDEPDAVICQLTDDATVADPLAGRRTPLTGDVDGLYSVNQHCDLVQLRLTETGTTVRVWAWK